MAGIGRYTPGAQIAGKPATIRKGMVLQSIHLRSEGVTLLGENLKKHLKSATLGVTVAQFGIEKAELGSVFR